MENFKNLNWSWKNIRRPTEQLSEFNKIFSDSKTDDILYCHLNDLNSNSLLDTQKIFHLIDQSDQIIDPRNNAIIDKIIIDYSKHGRYLNRTILHEFPIKSSLSEIEHKACMRVLKSLKHNKQISKSDQGIIEATASKRQTEHEQFTEYLKLKCLSKDLTNGVKELNHLYKFYLNEQTKNILAKDDRVFSLETALPTPSSIKTDINLVFQNSKIIAMNGFVPKYDYNYPPNFEKFKRKLTKLNSFDFENDENKSLNVDLTDCDVVIPEETLYILLAISKNSITEWEIPFELKCIDNDDENILLKFSKPFPLRCFNYATNRIIIDELLLKFQNTSNGFEWLKISDNYFQDIVMNEPEINAVELTNDYKINQIDQNIYNDEPKNLMKLKTNRITLKCNFKNETDSNDMNIIIESHLDYCLDKDLPEFLNLTKKLEYKKEFGSEIMTKSELLREWLRQMLIPNSTTLRYRLDVTTFGKIYSEKINQNDIENELMNLYKINPLKSLACLQEFFKTIKRFPIGHYLLKTNTTHQGKILVYKEKTEKTKSSFSTHEIYANILKNSVFLQNTSFLPIDKTLLTAIHDRHKILPCCFPHWTGKPYKVNNIKSNTLYQIQTRSKTKKVLINKTKIKKINSHRKKKKKNVISA